MSKKDLNTDLHDMGIGSLVVEMNRLYNSDNNVVLPESIIPSTSKAHYIRYHKAEKILNQREKEYAQKP